METSSRSLTKLKSIFCNLKVRTNHTKSGSEVILTTKFPCTTCMEDKEIMEEESTTLKLQTIALGFAIERQNLDWIGFSLGIFLQK